MSSGQESQVGRSSRKYTVNCLTAPPQASLVSGPLNSSAFLAKVSTSSESDNPGVQQHLICVYISDVYDKSSVTEVGICSDRRQNDFLCAGHENTFEESWRQS
jgi:hypothetical protein